MRGKKEVIGDACIYIISFISIAVVFGEIFKWMLYV